MSNLSRKGIRAAQLGILVNAPLAVAKLLAGIVGNAYAPVADAIESGTDIFSSLVVMSLAEAHARGGRVKAAIQESILQVASVLDHMQPFGD